jgi:DNA (cytosine-5)-methyltransferase 1
VGEAIGDLPEADHYEELLVLDSVAAKYGEPSDYAAALRGLRRDGGDYSRPRPILEDWLTSSLRTVHTPASIARFEATLPGRVEPVSRFLRLHPEGVSNTLRAGSAPGCR